MTSNGTLEDLARTIADRADVMIVVGDERTAEVIRNFIRPPTEVTVNSLVHPTECYILDKPEWMPNGD